MDKTNVKYAVTCNLQEVWDSSDLLTIINLYSIYNSNDQQRFFNMMECDHRGKGEGKLGEKKDNFELCHIFKEVLGLLAHEETTFMLNLSSEG